MHNLRRFYYQNKEKIWKIILFIVFCFALLQFANYLAKINNEKKRNQEALLNEQNKTNTSITVKDTYDFPKTFQVLKLYYLSACLPFQVS